MSRRICQARTDSFTPKTASTTASTTMATTPRRRGSTPLRRGDALSPSDARVEGAPRPRRGVTQLFLDAQELVVLRGPLAARDRAGLDLAGVDGHGEVGDERVLGLAGAVGNDRPVARALGELDRL